MKYYAKTGSTNVLDNLDGYSTVWNSASGGDGDDAVWDPITGLDPTNDYEWNGKATLTLAGTFTGGIITGATAGGVLTMNTGAILNCTTTTNAHIHVAGTNCQINATTINVSLSTKHIVIDSGATVSGNGNIFSTGGTRGIDNNGTITVWYGNVNSNIGTGACIYNSNTITAWHGNVTNLSGYGYGVQNFGTITVWYGNVTNLSGYGVANNLGSTITAWYGDIINSTTAEGDCLTNNGNIINWYGDVTNNASLSSNAVVNTNVGIIAAWYGNVTSSYDGYGVYTLGTITNWYGDVNNIGGGITSGLGIGILQNEGGTITAWYGNVNNFSTNCGVTSRGIITTWYGNVNNLGTGKGVQNFGTITDWYTYTDCSEAFSDIEYTYLNPNSTSIISAAKLAAWYIFMFGGDVGAVTIDGYLIACAAASRLPIYNGSPSGTIVDASTVDTIATGYPIGSKLIITPVPGNVRKGTLANTTTGTLIGPVNTDVHKGVVYNINASNPAIPDIGTLNTNYAK